MTMPDLRTRLASVQPGDTVTVALGGDATATGTVEENGCGYRYLGSLLLCYENGTPGVGVGDLRDHQPRVTVERLDALPEHTIVRDRDGDRWLHWGEGRWGVTGSVTSTDLLVHAPLTVLHMPGGEA